ncbi:uncharacterized protein DUF3180 [Mumia flava]|uniref:Uncharacterized protein DUF3180 n=1 Tax=Mumia flava TaxID=1348852 RepID=A0A0B2BUT3_9ACTN|nr:DUF3180 domain-containing protein [Mumia flava]PJJ58103.1 uncharacterized protein DUF3180 [Mumia flava]
MARRPLRRTSAVGLAVFAVIGLAVGRSVRPFLEWRDATVPTVSWVAAGTLVFLAAVLGATAWATYDALHRDRRTMQSSLALRLLALAKASAIVGSLIAGYYVGFAIAFLGDLEIDGPRERAIKAGVAAVAAVLVVVAALALERACEVPSDDDPDGAEQA